MGKYQLSHLEELEAESIFVLREVAAQFENPVLLFSGGKDSIVCYHLARKAFFPANVPFPLMHVDDLANSCLYFLQKPSSKYLINIGSGEEYSIKVFAQTSILRQNCLQIHN